MFAIPESLLHGPFARRAALDAGVSERVLEGTRFRRLHKGVYVHRDHTMTWEDRVLAAQLALPPGARTTGVTRLQQLGVDVGSDGTLHFVIEGDLHLALDGVFLHRTVKMPAHDDHGVTVEAAFIAFCADARLIDALKIGCFLLHEKWLDGHLLDQLLTEEKWRRGVPETSYVLPFLDDRPRSVPEGELLAYVVFAGMPTPEVNETITLADGTRLTPDQWFEDYDVAVEYEGGQHQDDREQYVADIDRYAAYRRNRVDYELVTKELMRSPRATVRRVHAALVAKGYQGSPPNFEDAWPLLFMRLADVVRLLRAA
jgi:hypothetical protein